MSKHANERRAHEPSIVPFPKPAVGRPIAVSFTFGIEDDPMGEAGHALLYTLLANDQTKRAVRITEKEARDLGEFFHLAADAIKARAQG